MLLVFVPKLTNRIGYTLNVVLGDVLRLPFEITTDPSTYLAHEGPRLCYGADRLTPDSVWIKSTQLLFQSSVDDPEVGYCEWEGLPALFPVYGRGLDFGFDLLAATFYLVARYEEYLPHRTDPHGRFAPQESVAYRHGFLRRPVVDLWCALLLRELQAHFPDMHVPQRRFNMEVTVDIDAAFCYRGKGFWRTMAGFARNLLRERDPSLALQRWRCITGKEEDPFNTFDYLLSIKEKHPHIDLLFFALLADYGPYDKNISHHNEAFIQLLKHVADYCKVGIHTSYASYDNPHLIEIERERLRTLLHHNITSSRAHFLRLSLPHSYRELQRYGIEHDYTMGYADMPGFRAGISVPYPFYDLGKDAEQPLTIHPFCIMDVTLKKTLHLSNHEALAVYREIMDEVHSVGGTFCTLFHNQYLCNQFGWDGWSDTFEQVCQLGESLNKKNND